MKNKVLLLIAICLIAVIGAGTIYFFPSLQRGSEAQNELGIVDILVDEIEKDSVKIRVRNMNPRPEGYIPESLMIDIVGVNLYYHMNGSFFTTIAREQKWTHFPVEPLEPEEEGKIWLKMSSIEYKPNYPLPYEKWEAQVIGKRLDTREEILSQLSIVPEYSETIYVEVLRIVGVSQNNTSVVFEIMNQEGPYTLPVEIGYVRINEVPLEGSSWTITKNPIEVGDEAILTVYYNWISEEIYDIEIVTQRGNIFLYRFTAL